MVIYPSKSGFDAWEKLGNSGWNWDSISPYLRKFHTLTLPSESAQEDLGLKYIDQNLQGRKYHAKTLPFKSTKSTEQQN